MQNFSFLAALEVAEKFVVVVVVVVQVGWGGSEYVPTMSYLNPR